MVTTRRQSGNISGAVQRSTQEIQAVNTKKRQLVQTQDDSTVPAAHDKLSPANTRKRQKLPVREKDEQHFERHTHIAVEIPVRDILQNDTSTRTVSEQRKSEATHKRFDSEEAAAEGFDPVIVEDTKAEKDDESSDDDAPEVVATHDAQKKATATARNAAKAVEEQDAIVRKKRKVHDTQLKEQAKTAKEKRALDNDAAENDVSKPIGVIDNLGENEAFGGFSKTIPSDSKDNPTSTKARTIFNKNNIPEFLPEEYLEDDPIAESISLPSSQQKPKRIIFTDPTPKKPKDRRKGSTIYRVAESRGDASLAPKAAHRARFIKESWLNGQRGPGGSTKVVKGGFFKNRK